MTNKIYITNEEEDISIEMTLHSSSATGGEQLVMRSIKALLRSVTLKDYEKYGKNKRLRYDADLNELAKLIHDMAAAAGWNE